MTGVKLVVLDFFGSESLLIKFRPSLGFMIASVTHWCRYETLDIRKSQIDLELKIAPQDYDDNKAQTH